MRRNEAAGDARDPTVFRVLTSDDDVCATCAKGVGYHDADSAGHGGERGSSLHTDQGWSLADALGGATTQGPSMSQYGHFFVPSSAVVMVSAEVAATANFCNMMRSSAMNISLPPTTRSAYFQLHRLLVGPRAMQLARATDLVAGAAADPKITAIKFRLDEARAAASEPRLFRGEWIEHLDRLGGDGLLPLWLGTVKKEAETGRDWGERRCRSKTKRSAAEDVLCKIAQGVLRTDPSTPMTALGPDSPWSASWWGALFLLLRPEERLTTFFNLARAITRQLINQLASDYLTPSQWTGSYAGRVTQLVEGRGWESGGRGGGGARGSPADAAHGGRGRGRFGRGGGGGRSGRGTFPRHAPPSADGIDDASTPS